MFNCKKEGEKKHLGWKKKKKNKFIHFEEHQGPLIKGTIPCTVRRLANREVIFNSVLAPPWVPIMKSLPSMFKLPRLR